MKKTISTIICIVLPLMANALDEQIEINGMWYNLIGKMHTAELTLAPGTWEEQSARRYSGDVVIPSTVEYEGVVYDVTAIGEGAFYNCSHLSSVNIPNSVQYIKRNAFNLSSLTNIIIPNSVKEMGDYAFGHCDSLESVTLSESLTTIPEGAFSNCYGLKSIIIPNSVTTIGKNAFANCKGLTSVVLGSSVKSMTEYSFGYCPELTDVYCFPEDLPNQYSTFGASYTEYATLHVPAASLQKYRAWTWFGYLEPLEEDNPLLTDRCARPVIEYRGNKLCFSCNTEGATFKSSISNTDIGQYGDNEVELGVAYQVSVYAIKEGYRKSETATAILCWEEKESTPENVEEASFDKAILIQSQGNTIFVTGAKEGTPIFIVDAAGAQAGFAKASAGTTTIPTSLRNGQIAIVKIGKNVVKFPIK